MANFLTRTEVLFTMLFVPHSCFKYHTKKPKHVSQGSMIQDALCECTNCNIYIDIYRLIYIYAYIIKFLILVGWGNSYQQINHYFIELQRIII